MKQPSQKKIDKKLSHKKDSFKLKKAERINSSALTGLSSEQVRDRLEHNLVNRKALDKTKSYTTIALRQINAIKALVSLLILQNALLSRFGNPNTDFTRNFNSVSGAFAFLFILLMSTYGLIVVMKERT